MPSPSKKLRSAYWFGHVRPYVIVWGGLLLKKRNTGPLILPVQVDHKKLEDSKFCWFVGFVLTEFSVRSFFVNIANIVKCTSFYFRET